MYACIVKLDRSSPAMKITDLWNHYLDHRWLLQSFTIQLLKNRAIFKDRTVVRIPVLFVFRWDPEPASKRHCSTGFPKRFGVSSVVLLWMWNRRLWLMSQSIFIVEVELIHRFHWKKYGLFFVKTFFVWFFSLGNLTIFWKSFGAMLNLGGEVVELHEVNTYFVQLVVFKIFSLKICRNLQVTSRRIIWFYMVCVRFPWWNVNKQLFEGKNGLRILF